MPSQLLQVGDRAATAEACANVALVKYWGKRDPVRNLPAVGSLSVTLADLTATARVSHFDTLPHSSFSQDGEEVRGVPAERMSAFLREVLRFAGSSGHLAAEVVANFPVGAGLASSAAIHCAVAAAALSALGRSVTLAELSALARLGSGSAARSVFGGFAEWLRGDRDDGSDSIARPLLSEDEWDLAVAVAIVSEKKKDAASRDAMEHVARTSPLYGGWLDAQPDDLEQAKQAIAARDLPRLGAIAEENCLRMHATCFAARPPVLYFRPATLAAIEAVRDLRARDVPAYFTIDAGPQVKVLCEASSLTTVMAALAAVPGVQRVIPSRPGPGVRMLEGAVPWK
jgi:diphosphomevalonate decarboxylase